MARSSGNVNSVQRRNLNLKAKSESSISTLWLQALSSRRFQLGFQRVSLHRPTREVNSVRKFRNSSSKNNSPAVSVTARTPPFLPRPNPRVGPGTNAAAEAVRSHQLKSPAVVPLGVHNLRT
jgi:hypothetical protein